MHLYFAMFGKLFALVATVHAVPTPQTWGIGTGTWIYIAGRDTWIYIAGRDAWIYIAGRDAWIYIAGRDVNNYRVKRRLEDRL